MRILLVAATVFEIRPFLERLPMVGQQDGCLNSCHYKKLHIDVLIPGVGMIPTAYQLGKQLGMARYDFAINAGIAGTFNKSIALGQVVNVIEDCVPELGAEDGEKLLSVFELGLADPGTLPYKHGKLVNPSPASVMPGVIEAIAVLPKATAITSNTVHGNIDSIARVRQIAGADIETMEGAAFFYACFSAEVPCVQIRAVSNLVEPRDRSRWNLDLALKNLNRALWRIVEDLSSAD